MAISAEENELLVRTGPGTPGGRVLRAYWQPAALSEELARAGAEVLVADLGHPAGLEAVAARLAATGEPVDLLVNNAGSGRVGELTGLAPGEAFGPGREGCVRL